MKWKAYAQMNERIHPEEELVQKLLPNAGQERRRRPPHRVPRAAAIAAAVLAVSLAMPPALAASPATYPWLYSLSPQVAQFFVPVNESCVDNGIRMEVLSTHTEGNTVQIYLSMRDLSGGCIDGTIDLFDSYDINTPYDVSGTCSLEVYDEETATAVFLITIRENSSRDLAGKKVTFRVSELLSRKQSAEDIALGAVPEPFSRETMELSFDDPPRSAYTLFSVLEYPVTSRSVTVLTPFEGGRALPGQEAFKISGIGWIDGHLHIQTATDQKLSRDAQAWLRLRDAAGNTVEATQKYSFAHNAGGADRVDYEEYIFDLPQGTVDGYTLYGDFSIAGLHTEGNWQVTFRLPE